MNATSYSISGTKSDKKTTLPKEIFGLEVKNHQLIKDAYEAYLANGRANLAVTKTRGLVSGGGRKPWRQKGTGRARFGSSRNPIWTGGGVAFGPTGKENYKKKMTLKAKRLALKQALSLSAADSRVLVIEDIKLKHPKTAELNKLLNKLDLQGLVLIVVNELSEELELTSRNIPYLDVVRINQLNVFDVLNADRIVLTKAVIKELDKSEASK